MKKIARNIIVAVLVLSLTLGIFAGCQKPTENKSLAEKYGITMSDKTVTYDGEKHAIAVSVDNTILQGKSYEVNYEYGGAVLTKAEFTDAGEYSVTAKIKVAGDEMVYPLTNKLTVKKAPLDLEVGNLFLRQGQGMATLGNPRDLFKDAAYIGKDTNTILGTLSFEIYNGNTKVNDLSTLKPSASVATPYKAKIAGIKDLTNYEVKLGEGKLYVLIDAEYDNAKSLKEEIATVPTSTTINTFDYYAMRAFASAADHIVTTYPSTTDIQKLMCGTVDVEAVKTLKKTADNRIATVYDFDKDIETAVGEIVFLGANHDKNDARVKEDKISEFKDKPSAKAVVEYGDTIAFDVIIYDTVKYNFTSVLINGEEFTADGPGVDASASCAGKKTNKPLKYSFGTVRTTGFPAKDETNAPGYGYSAAGNPGVVSGVQISNKLLGALDGKTTLTIQPVVGEVFDAGIYKGSSLTEITKKDIGILATDPKTQYPELSNLTITSKGSTDYDVATDIIISQLVVGKEYKFTITTMTGYNVVSVEIGDKLVLASQMENGSFTLKLTEDNISSVNSEKVVKILPTFEKVYSLAVKADTSDDNLKTLSNSNKDGVFTSIAGTIKLGGVSSTTVPTIGEEKVVSLTIKPDSGWLLAGVWVYQGNWISTNDKKVDITDDFEGATVVPLDLSEKRFTDKKFVSTEEINIYVKFRESYPIVIKATYDGNTTTMSASTSGQFTSKFGNVEILDVKKEPLSVISKDGKYFIKLEGMEGYAPKKIKVNGTAIVSDESGNISEGVRYPMIKSGKNIVINKTDNYYKANVEDATVYNKDNLLTLDTKLAAGEACVIEVEYAAYYYVSIDKAIPSTVGYQVDFGMHLTAPATGSNEYTITTNPASANTDNAKYVDGTALIKVGDGLSFYCYGGTKKIYARILENTTVRHPDKDNVTGDLKKYVDPKIIIGCDGNSWSASTSQRQYYSSVEDAITVPKSAISSDIIKYVQKTAIKPGESIVISFMTEYESK